MSAPIANLHLLQWSSPVASQLKPMQEAFLHAAPWQLFSYEDIAYTLRHGRKAFTHRSACVIDSTRNVDEQLSEVVSVQSGEYRLIWAFCGQGAQYSGMLRALYDASEQIRQLVDQACELLRIRHGIELRSLLLNACPENDELLTNTKYAQPALFIVAMAQVSLWRNVGIGPEQMLGHSLGEYCAACVAGVWEFEQALELVYQRGVLMASAQPGIMLSCQMSQDQIDGVLGLNWCDDVDIAAINDPQQLVLSAPAAQQARLEARLEQYHIRYKLLPTSHAYHSRMMEPILPRFRELLEQSNPRVPTQIWVSNLTGLPIEPQQATSADYWTSHLRNTVNFADSVAYLQNGDTPALFVEIGPQRHLSGLIARQSDKVLSCASGHPQSGYRDWLQTCGQLWCYGIEPDWQAFPHQQGSRVPLPGTVFQHKNYWADLSPSLPQPTQEKRVDEQSFSEVQTNTSPFVGRQVVRLGWAKVLGISVEQLKDEDNFFALGGNSMHLLDLVHIFNGQGVNFSIAQAYECLTLQAMEQAVLAGLGETGLSVDIEPFSLCVLEPAELDMIWSQLQQSGEVDA